MQDMFLSSHWIGCEANKNLLLRSAYAFVPAIPPS